MCGIVAIVREPGRTLDADISSMVDTLVHRGPDDGGFRSFHHDGVALGMRRLSILDIEGGQQPMSDNERGTCLVFNGEIYNFGELRRELEARGHAFQTVNSDTEVILHGYSEWGTHLFKRLDGMFAVVIWDSREKQLVLARDRAGEKPLYIASVAKGWAVASELKAFMRLHGFKRGVDLIGLEQYLAFDYSLAPRTILEGVQKLEAGHVGTITPSGFSSSPFWKPSFEPRGGTESDWIAELDRRLDESVRTRLVSDVPVGLFLSGGLDSTTVGYYMRRHSSEVESFSIGYEEGRFDESHYSRVAAEALGTRHHVEVFSQSRIRDLVPRIASILDEPMGDQSIFPTYLVSTVAQKRVKVVLGGDGSDELLMGYTAFKHLKAAWMLDTIPFAVRRAVATLARRMRPVVRGVVFARQLDAQPAHRLLSVLGAFKGDARSVLAADVRAQLPANLFHSVPAGSNGCPLGPEDETIAMYLRGYLQDDILAKVDRASMATSLEVRAPFLAPAVIDFLLSVPHDARLRGLVGKYLLRQTMRGKIPDAIIDRPKQGFGVPLNDWLRGSLAPLVRDTLDPETIRRQGFFEPTAVQRLVDEHLSGRRDWGNRVWLLVQFQLWQEKWLR